MLSGSLMLTFDDQGYRYDLPVYVINEALKYGIEKTHHKLPENFIGEEISISLRCTRFKDEIFKISTSWPCHLLKQTYSEKFSIQVEKLRIFFNGKELKNESFIHQFKIKDGMVLQVFAQY